MTMKKRRTKQEQSQSRLNYALQGGVAMKSKRKIKYSALFFVCWFALLVLLVDGVLKFQTLVDYFGSHAVVEVALLLLVLLPTMAVYIFTKEKQ